MAFIKSTARVSAVLTLVFHSACAASTAGIAIANVPVTGKPYEVLGQAETTKHWWSINLGLYSAPFGPPPVDETMRALIEQHKGDALFNIRFSVDQFLFPIFSLHRLHMKADVIRFGSRKDDTKR